MYFVSVNCYWFKQWKLKIACTWIGLKSQMCVRNCFISFLLQNDLVKYTCMYFLAFDYFLIVILWFKLRSEVQNPICYEYCQWLFLRRCCTRYVCCWTFRDSIYYHRWYNNHLSAEALGRTQFQLWNFTSSFKHWNSKCACDGNL